MSSAGSPQLNKFFCSPGAVNPPGRSRQRRALFTVIVVFDQKDSVDRDTARPTLQWARWGHVELTVSATLPKCTSAIIK